MATELMYTCVAMGFFSFAAAAIATAAACVHLSLALHPFRKKPVGWAVRIAAEVGAINDMGICDVGVSRAIRIATALALRSLHEAAL